MSRVKGVKKADPAAGDVTKLDDKGLLALYGAARFRSAWLRWNEILRAGDSVAAAEFKAAFAMARAAWAEHERRSLASGRDPGLAPWLRDGLVPGRPRIKIIRPEGRRR